MDYPGVEHDIKKETRQPEQGEQTATSQKVDPSLLANLLKIGVPKIQAMQDQEVLLVLGPVGAGKSTTISYLLGSEMTRRTERPFQDTIIPKNGLPYATIGHTRTSETLHAQAYSYGPTIKSYLSEAELRGFLDQWHRSRDVGSMLFIHGPETGWVGYLIQASHVEVAPQMPSVLVQNTIYLSPEGKDKVKYQYLCSPDDPKHISHQPGVQFSWNEINQSYLIKGVFDRVSLTTEQSLRRSFSSFLDGGLATTDFSHPILCGLVRAKVHYLLYNPIRCSERFPEKGSIQGTLANILDTLDQFTVVDYISKLETPLFASPSHHYTPLKPPHYVYCDTPGFLDKKRPLEEKICEAVSIETAVKSSKKIRGMVFVLDYDTFKSGKGAGVSDLSETLRKMFWFPPSSDPNHTDLYKELALYCALLVTKVPSGVNFVVEDVSDFFETELNEAREPCTFNPSYSAANSGHFLNLMNQVILKKRVVMLDVTCDKSRADFNLLWESQPETSLDLKMVFTFQHFRKEIDAFLLDYCSKYTKKIDSYCNNVRRLDNARKSLETCSDFAKDLFRLTGTIQQGVLKPLQHLQAKEAKVQVKLKNVEEEIDEYKSEKYVEYMATWTSEGGSLFSVRSNLNSPPELPPRGDPVTAIHAPL